MANSVSLLPNGRQQFFDANGNPLTGGTVASYIPSTLTHKTTWQDSGGTTPNTNPITLDGLGSAAIWGSGYYRQIVKDASGNTIWDQVTLAPLLGVTGTGLILDDVAALQAAIIDSSVQAVTLNGYYSAGDGGGALYAKASAGAGTGKVQSADGQWWAVASYPLNGRMLGAKADGATDDTTSLQGMLTLTGARGGGFADLPVGNCLITSTLAVPDGVSPRGAAGAPAFGELSATAVTRLTWGGANNGTMMSVVNKWCGTMQGIVFAGQYIAATALALSSIGGCRFQDLYFENTTGIAIDWHTDGVNVSSLNTWVNCYCHDHTGVGLQLSGGASSPVTLNTFVGCRFSAAHGSVRLLQYADTNQFYGGRIEGSSAGFSAIVINDPGGAGGVDSILFSGVAMDGGGAVALSYIAVPGAGQTNTIAKFDMCHITGFGAFNSASAGAQIKVVDCPNFSAFPAYGGGLGDYSGPMDIIVGASPFTYTNLDPFAEEVYVAGGAVTGITRIRDGLTQATGLTSGVFILQPSDQIEIIYTTTPGTCFRLAI